MEWLIRARARQREQGLEYVRASKNLNPRATGVGGVAATIRNHGLRSESVSLCVSPDRVTKRGILGVTFDGCLEEALMSMLCIVATGRWSFAAAGSSCGTKVRRKMWLRRFS